MEEQSISSVKYSPSVRIGNWFEEYCFEKDEIQNFLSKRKNGVLLTQKTRKMFSNLLKELNLSKMEPYIRFGDVVQLIATNFKISLDHKRIKPALSLVVTEKSILKSQNINDESEVTVAPSLKPCVRNTFLIKSAETINRDGEVLKFGQHFVIESTQEGCSRYVLFSSPKCANLQPAFEPTNVSISGGEMNNPVGVCPKVSSENLPIIPCGHSRWKCQHLQPSLRFESEDEPVPSNSRIVITHVATNQDLAAENVEFQSFFGYECLVSVHCYVDGQKKVQWQNVWCIKKGDENEPIH